MRFLVAADRVITQVTSTVTGTIRSAVDAVVLDIRTVATSAVTVTAQGK